MKDLQAYTGVGMRWFCVMLYQKIAKSGSCSTSIFAHMTSVDDEYQHHNSKPEFSMINNINLIDS